MRLATRGSSLARWQANHVAQLLGVGAELVVVETLGDRRRDVPVEALGGVGAFVAEVRNAVLDGRADAAVHSAKDLPSGAVDGLRIAAVPERGDPRDALVGSTVDGLPKGGRVGTGSARRRMQLAHLRPDVEFGPLRGNIETRLSAVGEGFDAVIVAAAALQRLGLDDRADELLDVHRFVPQPAQGALAVECRSDDGATFQVLRRIEHDGSRAAVDCERAFLRRIEAGCGAPVGAHAVVGDSGRMQAHGVVAGADGHVRHHALQGDDPDALGQMLAVALLELAGVEGSATS